MDLCLLQVRKQGWESALLLRWLSPLRSQFSTAGILVALRESENNANKSFGTQQCLEARSETNMPAAELMAVAA